MQIVSFGLLETICMKYQILFSGKNKKKKFQNFKKFTHIAKH